MYKENGECLETVGRSVLANENKNRELAEEDCKNLETQNNLESKAVIVKMSEILFQVIS